MESAQERNTNRKIIQISHGKIIPAFSSAYALRCRRYLKRLRERTILSVGGLIIRDKQDEEAKEYRSILMTAIAFLKGERTFEIMLSKGEYLRRKYLKILKEEILESSVVIFEGPWQFPLVKKLLKDKIVVYDAHNVETQLREHNKWEEYTREVELDLLNSSDLTITVSEDDRIKMLEMSNISPEKIVSIPEGYEISENIWKHGSTDIVFIGSAYGPNIDAAKYIIKEAGKLPEYTFKIIGTVCKSISKKNLPSNVKLLGMLDHESKERELCSSMIALNPVRIGSGRNLKMNDYISHGIPILTTEVGARGFDSEIRQYFFISEIETFADKIREISKMDTSLYGKSRAMIEYAKKHNYNETEKSALEIITGLIDSKLN